MRGKEASRQKQKIDRQPTLFTHFPLNPLGTATGILSSISIVIASVHFFVLREPQNRCGSRHRRVFFPLAQPQTPFPLPPLGAASGTHFHLLPHPGLSHKHPHTFPLAPLGAPQATCPAFPVCKQLSRFRMAKRAETLRHNK